MTKTLVKTKIQCGSSYPVALQSSYQKDMQKRGKQTSLQICISSLVPLQQVQSLFHQKCRGSWIRTTLACRKIYFQQTVQENCCQDHTEVKTRWQALSTMKAQIILFGKRTSDEQCTTDWIYERQFANPTTSATKIHIVGHLAPNIVILTNLLPMRITLPKTSIWAI